MDLRRRADDQKLAKKDRPPEEVAATGDTIAAGKRNSTTYPLELQLSSLRKCGTLRYHLVSESVNNNFGSGTLHGEIQNVSDLKSELISLKANFSSLIGYINKGVEGLN